MLEWFRACYLMVTVRLDGRDYLVFKLMKNNSPHTEGEHFSEENKYFYFDHLCTICRQNGMNITQEVEEVIY